VGENKSIIYRKLEKKKVYRKGVNDVRISIGAHSHLSTRMHAVPQIYAATSPKVLNATSIFIYYL